MTETRPGHLFGLDLVRCAAILLVLASHCGAAFTAWTLVREPSFLRPLGYYGVELFFALSGFLIGRILLDLARADATARGWSVFMARRWMRTLPLYSVWLAVLTMTWPPGLMHVNWAALPRMVPYYASFSQNLAWAQPDWFTVSWSLSVEEWFYLAFSLTLLVASRLFGARAATAGVLALFIGAPLLARLAEPAQVDWNEFLHKAVVFRLDAIAIGVAVVAFLRHRAVRTAAVLAMLVAGIATLGLQAGGWLPVGDVAGDRSARALGLDLTDGGFALTLPAMARIGSPRRWLGTPVRLFAAQSYGTYLVHYSLIEWVGFARISTHWSGLGSSLFCSALIVLLPAALWHGFEKPVLGWRPTASLPAAADPAGRGRRTSSI